MVKQYIVVRNQVATRDGMQMSAPKLAVMVSHASMCFLSRRVGEAIREGGQLQLTDEEKEWLENSFVKILLKAKNLHAMEKIVGSAEGNGLQENVDFFCIRDDCTTELLPDEGKKTAFVAIGFRPMAVEQLKPVVGKLQLLR